MIAVFDAAGNILWSWHIWVTAADLDAAVQTYVLPGGFAAAGVTVMMDRNLGALKSGLWETNGNNLSLGLLYQWGRKDPFPNIDDADIGGTGALAITRLRKTYDAAGNTLTADNTSADLSATSWRYINGKALSAEQIARYPMNFTCANSNWIDTPQDDLWGNPYSDEIGDTGRKSIYDPCPPGYRVPHRYVGTPFTVDGLNAVKTYEGWNAQYTTQAEIQAAGGNIFSFGNGQSAYPLGGMLFLNSGGDRPVPHRQVCGPLPGEHARRERDEVLPLLFRLCESQARRQQRPLHRRQRPVHEDTVNDISVPPPGVPGLCGTPGRAGQLP